MIALGLALAGTRSAAASPRADNLPEYGIPDSARFVISGSLSSEGEVVPVSASGAFSGSNGMLDLTLTAPEGETSGPEKITASLIVLDDKIYFKVGGLGLEDDEEWYVTDVEAATGMPGSIADITNALESLEPFIEAASTSKEVGKEILAGAPTTKYQIDVDLTKLATTAGVPPEGIEGSTLSVLLWIGDEDSYVHQFTLMLDAKSGSGDIDFSLAVDLTVTFSDFDTPIEITAPADATPLDRDASAPVLDALPLSTGGPLLGVGGMGTTGMPRTGKSEGDFIPALLLTLALVLVAAGTQIRRASRSSS